MTERNEIGYPFNAPEITDRRTQSRLRRLSGYQQDALDKGQDWVARELEEDAMQIRWDASQARGRATRTRSVAPDLRVIPGGRP